MAQTYIDRYEVIAELGRGGMATVFHAHDPQFKRDVAIKVMPREFLHVPDFKTRFQREAHTIAALEHDAIVPVHDIGEHDDLPFLVMRYMAGGSLADRIEREPLSAYEAALLFERLASAIDFAHAQGFVHRDLKPDNILFDQHGNAFIADFGIAKLMHSTSQLTGSGALVGTPAYMSPEQIQDKGEVDHRSDLYSLGVILYETLTGQMPFKVDSGVGYFSAHLNDPVPDIRDLRPDLSPAFSSIIYRAMAKDKDDRYLSAADLASDIALALDSDGDIDAYPYEFDTLTVDSPPTRRTPYALIGGATLVLLVLVGLLLSGVLGGSDDPQEVVLRVTATPELSGSEGAEDAPTPTAGSAGDVMDLDDLRLSGLIAFDSDRDEIGNREIYVMRPNGDNITRLTVDPAADTDPAWSSDGERIVFVSNRDGNQEIYVMDADGSNLQRLTDEPAADFSPDFSPDGTQIVFVSERDGNREIYTMNADGSSVTRLTRTEEARDEYPAWSPDGSQIAFSSTRTGLDRIYLMNIDGSDAVPITRPGDSEADWAPVWTQDGAEIGFVAARGDEDIAPNKIGTYASNVHLMNRDGTAIRRLTAVLPGTVDKVSWSSNNSVFAYEVAAAGGCCENIFIADVANTFEFNITRSHEADYHNPDWWAPPAAEEAGAEIPSENTLLTELAGAGQLLFHTYIFNYAKPNTAPESLTANIYIVDADGRDKMPLTIGSAHDVYPRWSPDAAHILFSSDRHIEITGGMPADYGIYLMDADGSNIRLLIDNPGDDIAAGWSPDGTQILFNNQGDIHSMNLDSTQTQNLTDNGPDVWDYIAGGGWSPDGSHILFTSTSAGSLDLYLIDSDGSNRQRLTFDAAADEGWATWSPDGMQIAYASTSADAAAQSNRTTIYVMDVASRESTAVSGALSADVDGITWSPDGRYLAYGNCPSSAQGCYIWVLSLENQETVRIVTDQGSGPVWQPVPGS